MPLDPQTAALYAIIAIALVFVGALLSFPGSIISVEQRAVGLGAVATILIAIAWRSGRDRNGGSHG